MLLFFFIRSCQEFLESAVDVWDPTLCKPITKHKCNACRNIHVHTHTHTDKQVCIYGLFFGDEDDDDDDDDDDDVDDDDDDEDDVFM